MSLDMRVVAFTETPGVRKLILELADIMRLQEDGEQHLGLGQEYGRVVQELEKLGVVLGTHEGRRADG